MYYITMKLVVGSIHDTIKTYQKVSNLCLASEAFLGVDIRKFIQKDFKGNKDITALEHSRLGTCL